MEPTDSNWALTIASRALVIDPISWLRSISRDRMENIAY